MQQYILNTPINSNSGTSLQEACTMINENFTELYSAITISGTSQLTNDGADGINPFITALDIPTTIEMSAVTGLNSAILSINNSITGLTASLATTNDNVDANTLAISGLTTSINTINSTLSSFNTAILNQNIAISQIQADIVNIYSIITP